MFFSPHTYWCLLSTFSTRLLENLILSSLSPVIPFSIVYWNVSKAGKYNIYYVKITRSTFEISINVPVNVGTFLVKAALHVRYPI